MIHISIQNIWNFLGPLIGMGLIKLFDHYLKLKRLRLMRKKDPVAEMVRENALIEYKLEEMLTQFEADRVYLLQFHNGGNSYPFGKSILKFSVFYEKAVAGVALVRDKFQNIPVSIFNKFFNYLSENNISYYTDIKKDPIERLEERGYNRETDSKSTYSVSIKNINGKFLGVLIIQYTKKKRTLSENQIKDIEIYSAYIGSALEQEKNKK